jgi:DNA (cytosine-5)-methyltransferase 1
MSKIPTLDLFAGCGGLSYGLSKAGFYALAANEYQPVFCESFKANHPTTDVICGDVTSDAVFSKLKSYKGKVEVLTGGPPCQGFSTVGSKVEADPRNKLFYAMMELAAVIRPRAILFENVSGFKRMYGGRAFFELMKQLEKMGYEVPDEPRVLNAVDYGAPQHRLRTIVVAFKKGSRAHFEFPEATHANESSLIAKGLKPWLTFEEAVSDLPVIEQSKAAFKYAKKSQNDFQELMRVGAPERLMYHDAPTHGEKLMEVMGYVGRGGCITDVPERLRPRSYFANTYARLLPDAPVPTMTRNFGTPSSSRCIHPDVNRGLTTREGARLQTFPDRYILVGSRGERNLQVGNAVPPFLATAVGKALARALK